MKYVLDACALIAFLAREIGEGYEAVRALLARADTENIAIRISIVNLAEVYYNFIKKFGTVAAADEIMRSVDELPIEVINTVSNAVYREASRLKAVYKMSLADAFACATAMSLDATLVSKDGEIEAVEKGEKLSVLWIK